MNLFIISNLESIRHLIFEFRFTFYSNEILLDFIQQSKKIIQVLIEHVDASSSLNTMK